MGISDFISTQMPELVSVIAFVIVLILQIGNIILTFFNTKKVNLLHVITNKRSERMDDIRRYSSRIMADCELGYLAPNISEEKKLELVESIIDSITSLKVLLQRAYEKDREIIDLSYQLKEMLLTYFSSPSKKNLREFDNLVQKFYRYIDLYLGAEWERLKYESHGNFAKFGDVSSEEKLWSKVYASLEENTPYDERKDDNPD